MSTFLGASIGRKLIVAVSGLFLILFLAVHLVVNLTLLAGQETYNMVAHWMGTNPAVSVIQPVLTAGLLVHIGYSAYVSLSNWRARPQPYYWSDPAGGSTWASRNMLLLGGLILAFLVLHISSFSIRVKLGDAPMADIGGVMTKDLYAMVTARFELGWYVLTYVVAMFFLGLHLAHGFHSGIQTLGLSDGTWRNRWVLLGTGYSIVIAAGYMLLPIYFFLRTHSG